MKPIMARVVEPGFETAVTLADSEHCLLFYSDTDVRFQHVCDRGSRGVIVCAPRLMKVNQPGGHQVSGTRECPTVRASILCPDCNTHGFVTEGRWADV